MDDTPIILLAIQSILGLYGAIYMATAIFAPGWFLDHLAINHVSRRYHLRPKQQGSWINHQPWYEMPMVFVTWLAVGVLVYAAVYAIVAIIPYDWGNHDQDGEWQSLRFTLQYGAGFFGGLALCQRLEKNAEILLWGPAERRARQIITEAVRDNRSLPMEVRESLALTVDKKLKPEPHMPRSYENDTASDLHRWIRGDIRG